MNLQSTALIAFVLAVTAFLAGGSLGEEKEGSSD